MVRIPKIQTLVAKQLMSGGGMDECDKYTHACTDIFSRVVPELDKGIPPRTVLEDVGDKREVDF